MSSRWTGFFVWALVAACVAFWGLKIFAATHPVPAGALTPVPPVATAGPMERLFGAAPSPDDEEEAAAPADSDRYQLVGVIAARPGSQGIAIVSVDNQPAKYWRVGSALEGETTLLAVAPRSAEFGPSGGPTAFTLELPPPQPPQTGTLPDATSQPATPVPHGQPQVLGNIARPQGGFLPGRPGFHQNPGERLGNPAQIPQGQAALQRPPMAGQAPQPPGGQAGADQDNDNSDE